MRIKNNLKMALWNYRNVHIISDSCDKELRNSNFTGEGNTRKSLTQEKEKSLTQEKELEENQQTMT